MAIVSAAPIAVIRYGTSSGWPSAKSQLWRVANAEDANQTHTVHRDRRGGHDASEDPEVVQAPLERYERELIGLGRVLDRREG